MIRVCVDTNAERVELFLNGSLLQTKQSEEDCYAVSFEVPFTPGELRAVAVRGAETVEDALATPSALAEVRLSTVQTALEEKDGTEIIQVEVSLHDRVGRPIVSRDEMLHFALAGNGEIMGIDNGAPDDLTPYSSRKRATFMGRLVVYVRPGEEKGPSALYVTAPGGVTANVGLFCE